MENNLKSRAGTFSLITLGGEIFDNEQQREELRLIMESIVVIQATHIIGLDQLAYVALCEQFEPLKAGEKVPAYLPMFNLNDEGRKISVSWERSIDYVLSPIKSKGIN